MRDTLDNVTKIEWDLQFPTLTQMRPSMYGWRRDVIPGQPRSRMEIDVTNNLTKLHTGESTIKGDRNVGGNPEKRVILQSSAK